MVRAMTLRRLAARLAVILPFAALLYAPSPGLALTLTVLGDAQTFAVTGDNLWRVVPSTFNMTASQALRCSTGSEAA